MNDDLGKALDKIEEYNALFPNKKHQLSFDYIKTMPDEDLESKLEFTKKEVRAWNKYKDTIVDLTDEQVKRVLVLIKGLVVLKSLVEIYNLTQEHQALITLKN